MAKQKNKKGRKAPRNARDIQTPVSDREKSYEPDAQKDGSEHHSAQKSKGKKPDNKARFARSPTREGDFAPNAGDYESNEDSDSDMYDAPDIDALVEHQPDPLSRWVKEIIDRETSKESGRMVVEFFKSSDPDYQSCQKFFENLNEHIREANQQNNVDDIEVGTIPPTSYNATYQAWWHKASIALEDHSPETFWHAFNRTYKMLSTFNERHHLPRDWNINNSWAEQLIGTPNPSAEDDTSFASSSKNDQPSPRQSDWSEIHAEESEVEVINETEQTGLNALEARTMQHQRRLTSAKVLYWWPKGTGSQIFVRYGDRNMPIYRIRAGSHESYDPSQVDRVFSTSARGTAKVIETRDGRPGEFWRYKREDVKDLLGIGWKVEDDDEDGLNPLNSLQPVKGATYPQTRTLVAWKDGTTTLEGRSFIRRIATGSALDGDRVIYQKAKELETAYRDKHGLGGFDDDYDDEDSGMESDDSIGAKKSRSRRNHSEPAYSRSTRRNANRRSTYETSEDSDTGSEISTYRHKRLRIEPARRSKPNMGMGAPDGHQARIRQLEQEIQRLKLGKSTSPRDKRREQPRTQR